jgi:hypothetical protein
MTKLRFKKIKFNWKKISWNKFFNYVFLILLSSLILLNFLIALPLTETLTDVVAFDLNVADDFWSKEYTLDLKDASNSDIQKTKNILFKRLNDYNVEEASVHQNDNTLKVIVKTTKSQTYVDELIRSPYQFSIVTRKEDVDFENEEEPLVPYLAENYNETQFGANTFRTIYINELPNSSGEDSYFGIAKPWPNNTKSFNTFLKDYEGEYVGINIDGFVTPVYISEDSSLFAIPINTTDEEGTKAIDILYNSGNIPTSYELTQQEEIDVQNFNMNYIEVTIAVFVSILLIYTYTFFTKIYSKDLILRSCFATLLSLATFLTFLKISATPIHIFMLVIYAILLISLTNTIEQNRESKYYILITLSILGSIFYFLGIGYLKLLGIYIVLVSIISFLSVVIGNFYINKVLTYFKK